MQRITWYGLLAVVALGAPIAGRAQAPQVVPQAKVREIATIEGMVNGFARVPGGRALIYAVTDGGDRFFPRVEDSTFTYDIATKRRTQLGTNMLPAAVSPLGDRLVFNRSSEDRTGNFMWTMPIDPKTGIATGQAQRVSLRPGRRAWFSPDGQTLALDAGPRPDGSLDLTIVPATGGPERVVATYARSVSQAWSADGKSLYVALNSNNSPTIIERVPVAGGRSEPLVPLTRGTDHNAVGVSPDTRVAFFHENPDRFFYRTASGAEGEISVALPPPIDDGSGRNMTLNSMLRYTTMTHVQNQGVRVLDLTTGQARDLLPGTVQSSAPAWSPDGRRLAVVSGSRSHYDITVVNADGSSPRRYPVPMHLDGWTGPGFWEMPWSPDGRFLAFRATDGQKVGSSPDDQRQLALLDVNSGQTRVLTTSSGTFARFVWRSSGNAIRIVKRTGSPNRVSIVEIPLNGPERLLRDLSAEFPRGQVNGLVFTSDREAVVTVTADKQIDRFLVPLDGGAARRLPDPGTEPGSRIGGTGIAGIGGTGLIAGNQLLLAQVDAKGEARVIKILSTVGDSTRALSLPFAGSQTAVVLPDGKQIVIVGKPTGDSVNKLFLVPLDGSATRLLGEIPRGEERQGGRLAPSPDGKLLAYTPEGINTSKIFEIDFGPALQAIMKR
jgi:Tol biopolymer transport system component